MDRRTDVRHSVETAVKMTVLSGQLRQMEAVLANVSGRGARLRVPEPIAVDSAVQLEFGDSLLLGEVCYCASDEGSFCVGVELQHSLLNLAEVATLRNRVLTAFGPRL